MSRSLRPLLPAAGGQQNSPSSLFSPSISKRTASKAACEACRKRKSKCTAERPRCTACIERDSACEYLTLPAESHLTAQRRQLKDLQAKCAMYEDLICILRSRPAKEADTILQKIRAGDEVSNIVADFHGLNFLPQFSQQRPEPSRYEFPYIREWPPFLVEKAASNPYLASTLYQNVVAQSPSQQSLPAVDFDSTRDDASNMFLLPYHSVDVIDARLDFADVVQWTTVSSDNTLLRRLMKIYFLFEFPSHPYFHKDLFLDALLCGSHRSQRFCSSLLVNAVLAAAWHGMTDSESRADFWHPKNMGYRFLAEARRLLDHEQGKFPKITTVQATGILNLTCNTNGIDELSWPFLHQSLEAAHKLGLFAHSPESDPLWQRAAAITAWSLFNWQAFACFQNFMPPLLVDPPTWPLSGPESNSDHYAEIMVKYPMSGTAVATGNGHVFRVVSKFRIVMNEVAREIFKHPRSPSCLSLETAQQAHSTLLSWYRELPAMLAPDRVALPSQLKVHMHFHALVVSLFEPFEHINLPDGDNDLAVKITQSKVCLETLLRLYYLRHGFKHYDATLWQFLLMLAFSTIRTLRRLDERQPIAEARQPLLSTLVLCAKGLWEQGHNCYISEASFYYVKDSLTTEDASLVTREITGYKEDSGRIEIMRREVRSQWPVRIANAVRMPVDNCLSVLFRS